MNEEESDDNDSTLIKQLVFLSSISRSKIRSSRRKVPISTLIENRKTKTEQNNQNLKFTLWEISTI